MSVRASVYNELVFGGHLLSLGTASIAATSVALLGRTPTPDLLLMAYLFSNGAYTLNRLSDIGEDVYSQPKRTSYLARRRRALPYLVAAYFLVGYALALLRNLYFFAALFLPLLLGILYSVRSPGIRRIGGGRRLKEMLFVKNITISFGWSLIPLLVGLYYLQATLPLLLLAPFIFLRLFSNTVFFDSRDVEADRALGAITIPLAYGERGTRLAMLATDAASLAYVLSAVVAGLLPPFAASLAVFPLYSVGYRLLARFSNKDVVRDLVADAEYLLWGPVVYFAK